MMQQIHKLYLTLVSLVYSAVRLRLCLSRIYDDRLSLSGYKGRGSTSSQPACTKFFFFVLLVTVGLSACDQDKIYESNVNIPDEGWKRTEHARFEVEITDTISPCNIYINVRNNSNYKYMELWLFVDAHSPLGTVERDTAKIMLADHRGEWLGHGLGDKFDTRIFFRKNVRFPASGKYIFEYEQATRDEPLIGIDDIGLRIEKAQ